MSNFTKNTRRPHVSKAILLVMACCFLLTGCQDGPLYGLKKVNPYFVMKEWKADRAFGVTDHERREALQSLADQIGTMPAKKQVYWAKHLGRIMNNDPSPEMRRLAVLAASRVSTPGTLDLIETGLDDESIKVQMASCKALGRRTEPRAAELLASVVGTTPELDVKNSAIAALGNHKGAISQDALRVVLDGQDPATTDLAMRSLRGVTGKDYGSDPKQWIAALDGAAQPSGDVPTPPQPGIDPSEAIRFAESPEGPAVR